MVESGFEADRRFGRCLATAAAMVVSSDFFLIESTRTSYSKLLRVGSSHYSSHDGGS